MKTSTKNGIDYNISLIDQHLQLITRGADTHMHVATSSATGDMTSESGRDLIRLNRGDDIYINALMSQNVSGNPAISAIVAKTDQYKNAIGVEL